MPATSSQSNSGRVFWLELSSLPQPASARLAKSAASRSSGPRDTREPPHRSRERRIVAVDPGARPASRARGEGKGRVMPVWLIFCSMQRRA